MLTDDTKKKIRDVIIDVYEDYKNGYITKNSSLTRYFYIHHVGPIKKSLFEDLFSLHNSPNDEYFIQLYDRMEKHRREAWRSFGGHGRQIRCKCCGKLKPSSDFYRRGTNGLQSWCKECCKEHGRLRNGTTGEYKTEENYESILSRVKKDISILRDKFGFKITFTLERTIIENY